MRILYIHWSCADRATSSWSRVKIQASNARGQLTTSPHIHRIVLLVILSSFFKHLVNATLFQGALFNSASKPSRTTDGIWSSLLNTFCNLWIRPRTRPLYPCLAGILMMNVSRSFKAANQRHLLSLYHFRKHESYRLHAISSLAIFHQPFEPQS